jgi:23S rRNA pseudouridine2605 synthase
MFYDEDRGDSLKNSDDSAPKKRKRISTGERYEKVRIGGSSPDGQRDRTPRFDNDRNKERDNNTDRNPNFNTDRNPRYNSDRQRDPDTNVNRDRDFNRDRNRDDSYGSRGEGFNRDRSRDNTYGNRSGDFNRDRNRDDSYGNRGGGYNRERTRDDNYGNRDNNRDNYGNRDRDYNRDRPREDNYGNRDENFNSERGSRYSQPREGREGFTKRPSYGSGSGGGQGRSYGSDQRSGGFKKSYGSSDNRGGYVKRGDKPYGKPGFRKSNDRYDNRPQRQPEYHFDEEPDNSPVRLNKFIANTGLCSRREADEHIQAGLISVNGKVITELGVKVLPTDDVSYNGKSLVAEKKVYILLNKPKDYVTSVDDPHAKRTIMELVQGACKERIYPVGRLDRMTTGVILLTNDGELTKKLTHPVSEIKKIYQVYLDKNVNPEDVDAIADGITLEDGFIKADNVGYIREEDQNLIGIEIHSGRNRIVRRIFEHFGYKVTRLDRIFFGGLTKKGLSRGKWRYLAPKEVGYLKMLKV